MSIHTRIRTSRHQARADVLGRRRRTDVRMTIARPAFLALVLAASLAHAQSASVQERVAALKQSLEQNQEALKHYEWIETTVVSVGGEQKSSQQARCYYGVDGTLERVEESSQAEQGGGRTPRGIRGRVVEQKKEEMSASIKGAVGLIKQYLPLDAAKIQAAHAAGKLSVTELPGGTSVRIDLHDYLVAGDLVSLEVDSKAAAIQSAKISSYLDSPQDKVDLDVTFAALPDGTNHVAQTTLLEHAENIRVQVDSSGYRKTG